ncbi:hypothetical protein Dcar01_02403 [Deinococcus carri]|uniref:Peptidase C-terminal archaeal/bacterial domain-containing protein n=1 Tax=Deinococcus carri TaxID=1211323 RepID=A0ABP9W8I2_9DEIO
MADLQVVGQVAGGESATVRLTVALIDDWRDERGLLPPPVYELVSVNGAGWTAAEGGPGTVLGSSTPGIAPRATVTYVLERAGRPPFARSVRRRVYANTDAEGVWDFTVPDAQQPAWAGGMAPAPTVNVLPGQGPRGERGASFLNGAGRPPAGLGLDGDAYLDTTTFDLWGRAGGAWTLLGNLRGGQGARGPEGPKGKDGQGFPKPTAQQVGYVALADGSQPSGFSWYPAAKLSLRLRDLLDVDLTDLQDGQTLVWSAAARKWKPGTAAAGSGPVEPAEALSNGVPVTVSGGPEGSVALYTADIPIGTAELRVSTRGGSGDVDMYVRSSAPPEFPQPWRPVADARSEQAGTAETVIIPDPQAGVWYVALYSYGYSDVTLTATWGEGGNAGGEPFEVSPDAEGYETITNADAATDADGYQTIPDATATADSEGYETVERSS